MKLLPSREVKNEKQSSALAESIRISEVRSELSREERELNEYKVFVFEEREKIKTDFDGKLMQWNDELTGIENQVKNLRAERAELLRPLDDFPDKIKENLASTDELIVYLTKRKQQVNKEKKEAEENNNEALKKLDELLELFMFLCIAVLPRFLNLIEKVTAVWLNTPKHLLSGSLTLFLTSVI